MPARFHPEAASEAEAAAAWYLKRTVRAAERFINELTSTLAMVIEAPHQWPRVEGNARRVLLRHYPYVVIYRVHRTASKSSLWLRASPT
jgi:plasmid stabilization system protein ParE